MNIKDNEENDTVFFLGAGASVPAKIPTTYEFVEKFDEYINKSNNERNIQIWNETLEKLKETELREKIKGELPDIEMVYEYLHKIRDFQKEIVLAHIPDYGKFFENRDLETIDELIQELNHFIRIKTDVKKQIMSYLKPLIDFLRDKKPLEIFTTNYDTVIEKFCLDYNLRYIDGFELFWNRERFNSSNCELKLYKIHGSVNWFQTDKDRFLSLPLDFDAFCESCSKKPLKLKTGEILKTMILYPMQKWERQGPLIDLLYLFKQKIQNRSFRIIISFGYSFRDEYLRLLVLETLKNNKDTFLFIISPSASDTKRFILNLKPKQFFLEEMLLNDTEENLTERIVPINSKIENILSKIFYIRDIQREILIYEEDIVSRTEEQLYQLKEITLKYLETLNFQKAKKWLMKNDRVLLSLNFNEYLTYALILTLGFYSQGDIVEAQETEFVLFHLLDFIIERKFCIVKESSRRSKPFFSFVRILKTFNLGNYIDDQFNPTQFTEMISKFRYYIRTQKYMINYRCEKKDFEYDCKGNWKDVIRILNLIDNLNGYLLKWKHNRKNLYDMMIYQRANSLKYGLDKEEWSDQVKNLKIIDEETTKDEIIDEVSEIEEKLLKSIIEKHRKELEILEEDSVVIDIIIDRWFLRQKFIERDELNQYTERDHPNI